MNSSKPIVIAIDGFSSCGKSTVAKQLANYFKFIYVDTGAMYRAVTYYLLQNDIDVYDVEKVENALDAIEISFEIIKGRQVVHLNNHAVEEFIRRPEVNDHVSQVAQISKVRKKMVSLQRAMMKEKSIVMDGRDIGTVVFPDAQIKIFITADIEIRAIRRYKELITKGIEVTKEEVRENLKKRDYIDSTREDSPLKKANDAILIDNSKLTKEEQLDLLIEIVNNNLSS